MNSINKIAELVKATEPFLRTVRESWLLVTTVIKVCYWEETSFYTRWTKSQASLRGNIREVNVSEGILICFECDQMRVVTRLRFVPNLLGYLWCGSPTTYSHLLPQLNRIQIAPHARVWSNWESGLTSSLSIFPRKLWRRPVPDFETALRSLLRLRTGSSNMRTSVEY